MKMMYRECQLVLPQVSLQIMITCVLAFFVTHVNAQVLARQVMASSGSNGVCDGKRIQQTIGQPYAAATYSSNEISFRPGFQQPVTMKMEFVRSSVRTSLQVYPNPATTSVIIKSAEVIQSAWLRITDMNGKPVMDEKLNGFSIYSLPCDHWPGGFYFLTVCDEQNNNTYTSKLIIIK